MSPPADQPAPSARAEVAGRRDLTLGEVAALPATVDLVTAARALGIGRTTAHKLARAGRFPCPVLRPARAYRVPTAGLLKLLGIEPQRATQPAEHTSHSADRASTDRVRARSAVRAG